MSDPIGKFISISWWRGVFQKTGQAFGWGCAVVFGLPLVIGFGWNQFAGRNSPTAAAVNRDSPLMTVNGETITMADFMNISQRVQMGAPGEDFARKTGEVIDALIKQVVIGQEAKRAGVKPSDADIDKAIQDFKVQRVGKNATDSDLENYVYQAQHISLSDFREQVAKGFLGQALLDNIKNKTIVTEEEARNQTAEVRLSVVLIATAASPIPGVAATAKPLPDAEAKQKAEQLLAAVKAGKADIAATARANSADFAAKQGGDTGYRPEYQSAGLPASFGVLGFGKEFDDAVHLAKPGDFIGVIKTSGFEAGYAFAKLVDRRNNLPKDFAPKKVIDQIKSQRAQEALAKKLDDLSKAAKVTFAPDRIEQKAYYDYFLESKMEQERFSSMSGPTGGGSEDQINRQKALADSEIEQVYKKDPNNTTAAILILDAVKLKLADRKTPPAEQTALRDRLLPLYQSVIKATEGDNYVYRFGIADALRDKKQFAEAYKNYHEIAHMEDLDIPTELKAMQDARQVRQQLALGFKTVASPEAPLADAEAIAQAKKVNELDAAIAAQQAKAAAEQKLQEDLRKKEADELRKKASTPLKAPAAGAAVAPEGFGKSLSVGGAAPSAAPAAVPGAGKPTAPAPAGTPAAPGGAPAAGPAAGSAHAPAAGAPAVPGGASSAPPAGGTGR